MQIAVPADLELFAIRYLRRRLVAVGYDVIVTNREPADLTIETDRSVVVCRVDGSQQTEAVTASVQLTVVVYGGSRQDERAVRDLAAYVYAFAASPAIATADGSPIAAVNYLDGNVGPYRITEAADRAAFYMSFQYAVVADVVEVNEE